MRSRLCFLLSGLLLFAAVAPAVAHHAFAAEFDVTKPVKIKGTTTKMEWTNPHAWLYVDVKEDDGKLVNWRFELGAPNALIRLGWKKDTIPAGIEVEIEGFRAKAGGPHINGNSVVLSDGKKVFSGQNDGGPGRN